jgi:hypothetical protein
METIDGAYRGRLDRSLRETSLYSKPLRIVGSLVLVSVLAALLFGAAVFGVPTVYSWWKQAECWLRGPDSYACWELDLLKTPTRSQR